VRDAAGSHKSDVYGQALGHPHARRGAIHSGRSGGRHYSERQAGEAEVKLRVAASAIVLIGLVILQAQTPASKTPYTTWSDYGGAADSMQYSALQQIDKSNVTHLELAWTYRTPLPGGRFAFSPLVVDDVMYVVAKNNAI